MTTERFAEIKTHVQNGTWAGKVFKHDWLKVIEQAERSQELETGIKHWEETSLEFAKENARLRKAIFTAIGKFNYDEHQSGMATLQQALAGDPDD